MKEKKSRIFISNSYSFFGKKYTRRTETNKLKIIHFEQIFAFFLGLEKNNSAKREKTTEIVYRFLWNQIKLKIKENW